MSKPVIDRVLSAFNTYRACVYRRERQRDHRRYYARKDNFGIAVHDDRYAREWQKWDRRAGVVEKWFEEHFTKGDRQ